jgi:hypothetical protein
MITPTTSTVSFLILVALLGEVVAAEPLWKADFPGPNELVDPTGTWSIVWKEPTSTRGHALLLKNLKTREEKHLLWFDRHVTVMWAPDGKALAITDYMGSTDAQILVAQPGISSHLIEVEKNFIRDIGRVPKIYENGHRYFEALNWIEPRTLRFKVEAWDTTPGGYEGIFRYVLGGKVSIDRQAK